MARLLTPEEFGVFTVASVLTAIAGSVRHFGVPEFLIQAKELDNDLLRAAFGVSLLTSVSLGVLLNLLAPWVQAFFGAAGIASVLHVLSIGFFLTPFAVVTTACFRRDLRMAPLLAGNLANSVVSFGVGIALAAHGHGALSLAWSATAGVAATVAIALIMKPASIPVWPSLGGAGRIFRFGGHASGVYLFAQAGTSLPDAIIAKAESVVAVAHFSRANGLVELFNRLLLQSIAPVVGPLLARSARIQGEVQTAYLVGTAHLSAVAWPLLLLIGVLSYPAVRLIYGAQWMESVVLAQVMCVAAAIAVSYHFAKDALLAIGQVRVCSYLQLKVQALRLIGLSAALPFGLEAGCWGLVAAAVAGSVLNQQALHRTIGLTFGAVARATSTSLRVALLTPLPTLVLVLSVPPNDENYLVVGFAGAALALVTWSLAMKKLAHPLWAEIMNAVRHATRRRSPGQ